MKVPPLWSCGLDPAVRVYSVCKKVSERFYGEYKRLQEGPPCPLMRV